MAVSSWHWRVSGLIGNIHGQCCCLFSQSKNVHSVDFTSFQSLISQHIHSKLVFGLYSCPTTILYSNHCPNIQITPDTTSHVQLARFSILFGGNFCEQKLVQGKLSNTVKWSTFSVSFIHMLTILGWL